MGDTSEPFVFLGNNPAVDFVNTQLFRRGEQIDLLQSETHLKRWAHQAGFNITSRVTADDFSQAIKLRSALKSLFLANIDGVPPRSGDLAVINRYLTKRTVSEVFQFDVKKDKYILEAPSGLNTTELLAMLAQLGAKLLASTQSVQLKRCGSEECILIFLDTSRSQKRHWCSMSTCGNRAKVAKHYRSTLHTS